MFTRYGKSGGLVTRCSKLNGVLGDHFGGRLALGALHVADGLLGAVGVKAGPARRARYSAPLFRAVGGRGRRQLYSSA